MVGAKGTDIEVDIERASGKHAFPFSSFFFLWLVPKGKKEEKRTPLDPLDKRSYKARGAAYSTCLNLF